jgi:hypothetical protein
MDRRSSRQSEPFGPERPCSRPFGLGQSAPEERYTGIKHPNHSRSLFELWDSRTDCPSRLATVTPATTCFPRTTRLLSSLTRNRKESRTGIRRSFVDNRKRIVRVEPIAEESGGYIPCRWIKKMNNAVTLQPGFDESLNSRYSHQDQDQNENEE